MKQKIFVFGLATSILSALPQEMQVVSGSAEISGTGGHLQIATGEKAILHWKEFSINEKESLQFVQPSASSAVLNRVEGGEISKILGQLTANGRVYLINPNGIIFGKDAVINTAAFIASTLDIENSGFLEGKELFFTGNSKEAIINYGTIHALQTVEENGEIYLRADTVSIGKEAQLIAPGGSVAMECRDLYHEGEINVSGEKGGSITLDLTNFQNYGSLLADGQNGGEISIHSERSYIESVSAHLSASGKERAGRITLSSGRNFFSSGTHKVTGEQGGEISIHAPTLALVSANLDASGVSQGGEVFIGDKQETLTTYIGGDNKISVNASNGSAGRVIILSKEKTTCYGTIEANGGFIEVSSAEELHCNAILGSPKKLLLDPKNIIINATTGIYPQYELIDPNAGNGTLFGSVVVPLTTGNVVVTKPGDDVGGANAGAVYLYNSTTAALISTVTGSQPNDSVGNGGVTALSNGNYVVRSLFWDNGGVVNAGAVTFGNGITGITGTVSGTNSLVGSQTGDLLGVGSGVTALSNGNYVVRSPFWDNGGVLNVGAVTFGNGSTGITGTVTVFNSLVGSQANDRVGLFGVTALSNGNYVVSSRFWDNGGVLNAGAVTFGNGTTGIIGTVTASNSLVGSQTDDLVGNGGVTALSNGNYVVGSSQWANGTVSGAGAATFGNGTTGITGTVSASNSLVGSQFGDSIGVNGVTALSNGNYVVSSSACANGLVLGAGAATFGNGTTGITGTVTVSNSLVGSQDFDEVGNRGVAALSNGNYVVSSSSWANGTLIGAGAATFGNGATGITGTVSVSNSLVGSQESNEVGNQGVTALTNGNYVVCSSQWANGLVLSAGAATFGNGITGITGTVSSANSLVGSQSADEVGLERVIALSNGNYVVNSRNWSNGGSPVAGAATFGNGTFGVTGTVSAQNSVVGEAAFTSMGTPVADNIVGVFFVPFRDEGSGKVRVGLFDDTPISFAIGQGQDMTIPPSFIETVLEQGGAVVLEANDDITINDPIVANMGSGDFTLSAGRTVLIEADVITGSGSLIVTANDPAALSRSPGIATVTIAPNVTIETGGDLVVSLLGGAPSGDLTIGNGSSLSCSGAGSMTITAVENSILLEDGVSLETVNGNLFLSAGKNITASGSVTAQILGSGVLTMVVDTLFPTAPGSGTGSFVAPSGSFSTGGGKLLIYTSKRDLNSMPTTINGVSYTAGPLFVNSTTEKWGTYYPNSSGIPFTIFYKNKGFGATVSSLFFTQALYKMVTAIAEPSQLWNNPWYSDYYFGEDNYPPYRTPKNLLRNLPSLVEVAE